MNSLEYRSTAPTIMKTLLLFLIAVLWIGTLVGCNRVDQGVQDEAQAALDEAWAALALADSAEANLYVANIYEAAVDSLEAGQAEMEAEAYDRAHELFLAAAALATQAASEASLQKTRIDTMPDTLGTPDSLSNGRG